jgi:hypothetical protein
MVLCHQTSSSHGTREARGEVDLGNAIGEHARTLTTADLVPGYLTTDRLYLRLFIAARRYLSGDRQYLSW